MSTDFNQQEGSKHKAGSCREPLQAATGEGQPTRQGTLLDHRTASRASLATMAHFSDPRPQFLLRPSRNRTDDWFACKTDSPTITNGGWHRVPSPTAHCVMARWTTPNIPLQDRVGVHKSFLWRTKKKRGEKMSLHVTHDQKETALISSSETRRANRWLTKNGKGPRRK